MKAFLLLAAVGLCWAQYNPNTNSRRTSIVHLFEWRWADIALEREWYLAPYGSGGVQILPPNENIIVNNPWRPWWERYQPIRYKLCTRSGNEHEFKDMVTRCNNVGVHIYVDAVVNHMCRATGGSGSGTTCRSYFNADRRDFPSVPYSAWDFNDDKCKTESGEIENFNDVYQVIDFGGEAIKANDYFGTGQVTEFKYGAKLGSVIRKWDGEKMAYLKLYKMAVGFMLAHPYGFTWVMSSYRWTRNFQNGKDVNDWIGPPSNDDGSTKAVTINADSTCGNGWICEHRWLQIRNMVIFHNVVNGQSLSNCWDNGSNQVAFGCGNKGFIVFNNDDWNLNVNWQTGLPAAAYCDVISGQKEGNSCTGIKVNVGSNGIASFQISNQAEDPFIAIHVNAKL